MSVPCYCCLSDILVGCKKRLILPMFQILPDKVEVLCLKVYHQMVLVRFGLSEHAIHSPVGLIKKNRLFFDFELSLFIFP